MGRNMLVDGVWETDVEPYTDESGAFDRAETSFRDWIRATSDSRFRPATGRYHLYAARNCPWAHGAVLARRLAGLTDVVSMDVIDTWREDDGWEFTPEKDGCTPDTVNGCDYLRDVYVAADPEYTGRVTVPVLWDGEHETVVNNESIELVRMFATEFDDYGDEGRDLYPEGYRDEIDRIVDLIYDPINDGVYRAGLADSQAAYDEAVTDVFDALDRWDAVLADQRYLAGDRLTLADVRMFPTLIRFDGCYHTAFECNRQYLHQYDHLWTCAICTRRRGSPTRYGWTTSRTTATTRGRSRRSAPDSITSDRTTATVSRLRTERRPGRRNRRPEIRLGTTQ